MRPLRRRLCEPELRRRRLLAMCMASEDAMLSVCNDGDMDGDGYVSDDYAAACPNWEDLSAHLGTGDCWDDLTTTPSDFTPINGYSSTTAAAVSPSLWSRTQPPALSEADCSISQRPPKHLRYPTPRPETGCRGHGCGP